MSCHLVAVKPDARARVDERFAFRGLRAVYGEADAWGAGGPELCDALIDCQLGERRRHGSDCLRCPRLVSWEQGPSPREVTVRCRWSAADPVAARMTGLGALVWVRSDVRCVEADRAAAREGVHRLLVVDRGLLVGIVCRHDLESALSDRVADHMRRDVYIIDAEATLGDAAAAMYALDVGCLPVTRGKALVGILTRGDLVRAGLPEETLP